MKFLVIFFCSFLALFTCHAALIKRYFGGNVQNHFTSRFEPELPYSFSGEGGAKEDIGKLTTSLLHDIHIRAGKGFNIVLSPVSVWMILAMLLEGADGKTERELKTKLHLSYGTHEQGRHILRNRVKELLNFKVKESATEFENLNFVISDKTKVINPEYKKLIGEFYNGRHFEVSSEESEEFSRMINTWASQVTKKRIPTLISPAVLSNLLLVVGNAVYFKSKWKSPFDPSQTILLPFKDDFERPIKDVPMMNQIAVLPYGYNWRLESEIIEIPYADGLTSMTVILPRERVSLSEVLSKMRYLSLDQIIPKNFSEETVQLSIPKFHIESKMYLNEILKQDLRSVFSPQEADFPKIGKNIFVSKVFHKAEMENTEQGTIASAFSSVQFAYKSSSVMFRANRPFIYLISEMKSRTILFAGTYSNPFIVQLVAGKPGNPSTMFHVIQPGKECFHSR